MMRQVSTAPSVGNFQRCYGRRAIADVARVRPPDARSPNHHQLVVAAKPEYKGGRGTRTRWPSSRPPRGRPPPRHGCRGVPRAATPPRPVAGPRCSPPHRRCVRGRWDEHAEAVVPPRAAAVRAAALLARLAPPPSMACREGRSSSKGRVAAAPPRSKGRAARSRGAHQPPCRGPPPTPRRRCSSSPPPRWVGGRHGRRE